MEPNNILIFSIIYLYSLVQAAIIVVIVTLGILAFFLFDYAVSGFTSTEATLIEDGMKRDEESDLELIWFPILV